MSSYINYLFVFTLIPFNLLAAQALSIQEVGTLALERDPGVRRIESIEQGLLARSVADGQLPDPKLKLGLNNIPVDSFNLDQEPMTQIGFGLTQAFPPGKTLHFRQEATEALSEAESRRAQDRRLNVVREARLAFLELYLQSQTASILEQNRAFIADLLDITERQYAAGLDNQHDVLRAQLELSLIEERILATGQSSEAARALLSRYIGLDEASRPVAEAFPELTEISTLDDLAGQLEQHPLIQIENAMVDANQKRIAEVEESYKPGFNFDITYGARSGNDFDGSDRADFLSAFVMVDLPIFKDKRQDKRFDEATGNYLAATYSRTDRLYELQSLARREYANWEKLGKRHDLLQQRALDDARSNTESTLYAYQNDLTDFTTLMRAQLTELNTRIDTLKVRIDRARAQANLLYFGGQQ